MTVAAGIVQSPQYRFLSRAGTFWRRSVIMVGLVAADLVSFALADVFLHVFDSPPALALFRGQTVGTPRPVVDLVALIALLFVMARYLAGDYSRRQLFWDGARATTNALTIGGIVYAGAVLMFEPRGLAVSLAAWFGLLFLLPSARQVMRLFLGYAGVWNQPTAILGTCETAQEVYPALSRQLSLGMEVRWVVPENAERNIPASLAGLTPVHVTPESLVNALLAIGCRQAIIVPDDRSPFSRTEIIDQLLGADIAVSIVPSLRRLPLFGLSTSYFFGKDLLLLQVRNNLARLPQRILKRTIDVAGSLAALALFSPLFLIVAFLIRREDGGPVFFIQNRVGRNGQDFRCWKFRTMVVDAEAQMARWAQENPVLLARYRESNFKLKSDPRVTRVGAWLRRTSLDEIPQLLNILMGHMSLVGPRPLLRRELADYGAVISLYECVRPGVTGLWQISGRSHTTFAERVSYDEWYIKNWTVWYDIVILFQTVWVLLRGEGAY